MSMTSRVFRPFQLVVNHYLSLLTLLVEASVLLGPLCRKPGVSRVRCQNPDAKNLGTRGGGRGGRHSRDSPEDCFEADPTIKSPDAPRA